MTWGRIALRIPRTDTRQTAVQVSTELASSATVNTPTLIHRLHHAQSHPTFLGRSTPRQSVELRQSAERRQWVRFVVPNLVTRLGWINGTEAVAHLVTLVNVSASGAAVLMDVKPPHLHHFEHGGISSGPIIGQEIEPQWTWTQHAHD